MTADTDLTLPRTLALVDDDVEYSEFLAQHLESLGVAVRAFADSSDLLASAAPFDFGFYIVDLMLPGMDGGGLITLLRRRTRAGVMVVSGHAAPDVFARVIDAGADLFLAKPVTFEQVVLAVRGVYRRVATAATQSWSLDRLTSRLLAPDGVPIELGETELALMQCFLDAAGAAVSREDLCRCLGQEPSAEAENQLSATVFRLRRRIEQATPLPVPLQTQARAGYLFRGELKTA